jgi:hypothetical protein
MVPFNGLYGIRPEKLVLNFMEIMPTSKVEGERRRSNHLDGLESVEHRLHPWRSDIFLVGVLPGDTHESPRSQFPMLSVESHWTVRLTS